MSTQVVLDFQANTIDGLAGKINETLAELEEVARAEGNEAPMIVAISHSHGTPGGSISALVVVETPTGVSG